MPTFNTDNINFPVSEEYFYCPAMKPERLQLHLTRFKRFQVKYSIAAGLLGVFHGGYRNCPSVDDIQGAIQSWWIVLEEFIPAPDWDPQIVDPFRATALDWQIGDLQHNLAPLGDLGSQRRMVQMIQGWICWTTMLVGCNTMTLELKRMSTRGRPRKER